MAARWPDEAERRTKVEVVTYAPTVFYHCQHCELTFREMGFGDRVHRDEARDALPDDLHSDFAELSDWIHRLVQRHGDEIDIRIIDAASIQGFWKSLRHNAHKYPAVIVDGTRLAGTDVATLERELEGRLTF